MSINFEGVNNSLYFCCQWCDKPMTSSWLSVWTEDKQGNKQNITFLHYKCLEIFELENADKGKWLSRGNRGGGIEM